MPAPVRHRVLTRCGITTIGQHRTTWNQSGRRYIIALSEGIIFSPDRWHSNATSNSFSLKLARAV